MELVLRGAEIEDGMIWRNIGDSELKEVARFHDEADD